MPFEEDEQELDEKKSRLNKVSTQKSIFDGASKKKTQAQFTQQVMTIDEQASNYKFQVKDLAIKFKSMLKDQTLLKNKTSIQIDVERETMFKLINLANQLNCDENEQECSGSLALITLLFNAVFYQRDKINELEYEISMNKK
jgi:hypothetical protein